MYSDTSLASAVVALCFILLGLPSNFLIIFGVIRQRLYTQPTYILLLNLAVSDLLVCLCVLPFTVISGFSREFILGSNDKIRCRVCQTGITLVLFAGFSLHCLAALSIDRLIFIKFPLRYSNMMTAKGTAIAMVILWLLNICLSILPLFGYGDIVFQEMVATCTIRFTLATRLAPNYFYVVLVAVVNLVPFSLILISNIWILCIVQKHIRKIYVVKASSENKAEFIQSMKTVVSQAKHYSQLQLIKVFGAIFVANVLTWIPIIIRSLLSVGGVNMSEWWHFVVFVSLLSFVVLHPVIQTCLIPEFRAYIAVFLKCLLCPCYRKSSHTQPSCPCCHQPTADMDEGSSNECLCKCGGSFCTLLSITVLSIRDEFGNRNGGDSC